MTDSGQKAQADWHHNGSKTDPHKYKESRSRQVFHMQERLREFLAAYGFGVQLAAEPMMRLWPGKSGLPLARLPTIEVFVNRLNKTVLPAAEYLSWLNAHGFGAKKPSLRLSFELVAQVKKLTTARPLLVLTHAAREAFSKERQPGLLAQHQHQDPLPGAL